MDVDITVDQRQTRAIVRVKGAMTAETAPALVGSLDALLVTGGYDVVVDLTQAHTFMAGGVRALRHCVEIAEQRSRGFSFACPRCSANRPVLAVAGLDRAVRVYETAADAPGGWADFADRPLADRLENDREDVLRGH